MRGQYAVVRGVIGPADQRLRLVSWSPKLNVIGPARQRLRVVGRDLKQGVIGPAHQRHRLVSWSPKLNVIGPAHQRQALILKGSKASFIGRALSRIQCALLINNPVGIWAGYINTHDNVIADRISRILSESHLHSEILKLFQDFPDLKHLRRFQPSAELISLVMDALLKDNFADPLLLSRQLLANPGKIIS